MVKDVIFNMKEAPFNGLNLWSWFTIEEPFLILKSHGHFNLISLCMSITCLFFCNVCYSILCIDNLIEISFVCVYFVLSLFFLIHCFVNHVFPFDHDMPYINYFLLRVGQYHRILTWIAFDGELVDRWEFLYVWQEISHEINRIVDPSYYSTSLWGWISWVCFMSLYALLRDVLENFEGVSLEKGKTREVYGGGVHSIRVLLC